MIYAVSPDLRIWGHLIYINESGYTHLPNHGDTIRFALQNGHVPVILALAAI